MALRFDNGAVHSIASVSFPWSGPWSVAARVFVTGTAPANLLYIQNGNNFIDSIWLGINVGDALAMYFTANNTSWSWAGPTPTVAVGTWFHIVLTYDGLNTLRWYYNGNEGQVTTDPAISAAIATRVGAGAVTLTDGRISLGSDFTLQDVAAWTRTLTANEVAYLNAYTSISSSLAQGLYFWLPMYVGSAYTDQSGNAHTLSGGADEVSGDPAVLPVPVEGRYSMATTFYTPWMDVQDWDVLSITITCGDVASPVGQWLIQATNDVAAVKSDSFTGLTTTSPVYVTSVFAVAGTSLTTGYDGIGAKASFASSDHCLFAYVRIVYARTSGGAGDVAWVLLNGSINTDEGHES